MKRAALILPVCLALAGCRAPEIWYSVPAQQQLQATPPQPVRSFLQMSDLDAEGYFAKDIGPDLEDGSWRWTGLHPTLQVPSPRERQVALRWQFALPKITFSRTGPVTVCFLVNGHELETRRYDHAGDEVFEKPVPPEWVRADALNEVSASIQPPFMPDEGGPRGFVLIAAGLVAR